MENIKKIIDKWDVVLNDIDGVDFNLEHFREAAIESFKIILPELKNNPDQIDSDVIDSDVARLLMRIARFAEKETVSDEQFAAQYVIEELLFGVDYGMDEIDIDENNILTLLYAPNSFSTVKVDLNSFDLPLASLK